MPTQAGRQVSSEVWTSGLGEREDSEQEVRALAAELYGAVGLLLKRRMG